MLSDFRRSVSRGVGSRLCLGVLKWCLGTGEKFPMAIYLSGPHEKSVLNSETESMPILFQGQKEREKQQLFAPQAEELLLLFALSMI